MEQTRARRRLADELDEDGIDLPVDAITAALVVEELDYARRTPMFEGRRPVYGAMVAADLEALARWDGVGVDLVDPRCQLDDARTYADGRSSYLIRDPGRPDQAAVACFDRPLQFEADLVALQQATGALIVQRTPVFGVSRVVTDDQVVSWDGRSWAGRATARSLLPQVLAHAPDLDPGVAEGVLTLAVHWLAPARARATLVVDTAFDDALPDTSGATPGPDLTITNRRHYPPLLSCLMQRDLATLIDGDGALHALGVGLRATDAAHDTLDIEGGMRHRSAQRWSYDHPTATVTVVSADGPVSVYRAGDAVIGGHRPPAARAPDSRWR